MFILAYFYSKIMLNFFIGKRITFFLEFIDNMEINTNILEFFLKVKTINVQMNLAGL